MIAQQAASEDDGFNTTCTVTLGDVPRHKDPSNAVPTSDSTTSAADVVPGPVAPSLKLLLQLLAPLRVVPHVNPSPCTCCTLHALVERHCQTDAARRLWARYQGATAESTQQRYAFTWHGSRVEEAFLARLVCPHAMPGCVLAAHVTNAQGLTDASQAQPAVPAVSAQSLASLPASDDEEETDLPALSGALADAL